MADHGEPLDTLVRLLQWHVEDLGRDHPVVVVVLLDERVVRRPVRQRFDQHEQPSGREVGGDVFIAVTASAAQPDLAVWAGEGQLGIQDGDRSGVVADDQQQAVAQQHAAGLTALFDAEQLGDAGPAHQAKSAHA